MPTSLRSLAFASLIGLVALPVLADVSSAPDRSRGSGTLQQAGVPGGTGLEAASGTDLDKSYSWDKTGAQQAAAVWPPDERMGPMRTMAQIAPALLMIVLAAIALAITFTSLRKDMKQRRGVVYRPRGHRRAYWHAAEK